MVACCPRHRLPCIQGKFSTLQLYFSFYLLSTLRIPTHLTNGLSLLYTVSSQIGDLIGKCAEDTEKLIREPHPPEQYAPKAPVQSPHGPGIDEISAPRQPQWPKPGAEQYSRYQFSNHADRPAQPQSSYYYPSDYVVTVPRNSQYLQDRDLDDEALRFRRKRRSSTPNMELERYVRRIGEEEGKIPRHKRIRLNWTAEENKVFYDTVSKHSTLDEQSLIREIVATMGGKRNWTQCKGHFRNLVFVNKIVQDDKTKHWNVNETAKGNRGSSSKQGSEQSGSDGRPGDKVENGESQPLKDTARQEEDKDEDEDDAEDVELGGEDIDADDVYAARDDGEDPEGAKDGNEDQNLPKVDVITKVVKGNGERGMKSGADVNEQARTRGLKGTRGETRLGDKSLRLQNGERRGSDEEDGKHTMPHRKQMMSTKRDNGTTYTPPSRRVREFKRRNTADYRPASYAEGRRYLK